SPRRVAAALRGRRVSAVGRKGKHLWLELDRRPWPAFHFGMSGSFRVYGPDAERPRYWKLELEADDGARLALRDPRRLGRIRLLRHLGAIVALAVKVLARKQEFPRGWLFHRRWGRDSSAQTLRAERIVHETIGGRTAAWVPSRQR